MSAPLAELADALAELGYRRRFFIRRTIMLDNACGALARRAMGWAPDVPEKEAKRVAARAAALVATLLKGGAPAAADRAVADAIEGDVLVIARARPPLVQAREGVEKQMKALARRLPAHDWQKGVRGFGELGLASIVAEAGDLNRFAAPEGLWRRCGLAPFKGRAGSVWRRKGGLSADEWKAFGYAPQRLGALHGDVTVPLLQGCKGTVYRAVYDHAKASFAPRADSPKHAHMHAMRVMTKELLRDLWRVWHGLEPRRRACAEPREDQVPPALAAE